jgi:alpha-1,6-mannosyltransferase
MMNLMALGTGQLLCYLFLVSLGDLRRNILGCEIGFFTAFLLYGMALFLCRRNQSAVPKGNATLLIILCFAVCFRLCMLASTPSLSDDIYRYLWEGKLFAAGINPFAHAPSDPALAHLQDPVVFPHINHKEHPAIYPPLTQLIFAVSALISPTITGMKIPFILFDLLSIALLLLILRERREDSGRVIIYAWNPLIIVEFAGSGHLDSAGIFFLMLALYLFSRRKSRAATFCLAFSFLAKFIPLLFLPFFLTRRKVINLGIFCIAPVILYLPFADAGRKLCESLFIYSQHWVFNASLYEVMLWTGLSSLTARGISAILMLLLITGLLYRSAQKTESEQEEAIYHVGFIALGGLLLLTPVLHPWYVCWIVPFLVILPNRAWIYLTGSVFLSYAILKGYAEGGVWEENPVVKLFEYLPFYTLLIYDAARGYRAKLSLNTLLAAHKTDSSCFHPSRLQKTNER